MVSFGLPFLEVYEKNYKFVDTMPRLCSTVGATDVSFTSPNKEGAQSGDVREMGGTCGQRQIQREVDAVSSLISWMWYIYYSEFDREQCEHQ